MVCGNIFKTLSIPNRNRECSSYTMCHVLRFICHVSLVTCHLSHVTCHMSHVTCHMLFFFKCLVFLYPEQKLDNVVELVGGGSVINRAYPFFSFFFFSFNNRVLILCHGVKCACKRNPFLLNPDEGKKDRISPSAPHVCSEMLQTQDLQHLKLP